MKEYQSSIENLTAQMKKLKLPSLPTKAEKKDYEERRVKLEQELNLLRKYAAIYAQVEVAMGVAKGERAGVIVDKFVNEGGIPQLWIIWGISRTPYPEYPSTKGEWRMEFFAACNLDEAPIEMEKAA